MQYHIENLLGKHIFQYILHMYIYIYRMFMTFRSTSMAFKFIQLMCDDCQLLELLTIPTYCNLFRTCKAFGQCLPPARTFYSCHLCHCFTTSIKQCSNKPSIKVEGLPVCRNPHRHGTMFDCSVMQHLPQGFQPVLATSEMEEVAAIPHLIIVNDFAFYF